MVFEHNEKGKKKKTPRSRVYSDFFFGKEYSDAGFIIPHGFI